MKKIINLSKLDLFALALILIVGFLSKLPFTILGFFAFTYDQGRDFLEVSKIIYEHNITLIGPTTGLQGIFYGPWWYYFLSPVLFVAQGNPQIVAITFGLIGLITLSSIYLLIKLITKNIFIAFALTLIAATPSFYLFTPVIIWSPTLAPILLVLFFVLVNKIFQKPKPAYFFMLGAVIFLIEDSAAAFGIVLSIAFAVTVLIFKGKLLRRELAFTIAGALVILSPRILFDLRHNFLISKSIFAYLSQPKIYGEHLNLFERLISRLDLFWGIFSDSFTRSNKPVGLAVIVVMGILSIIIKNNKSPKTEIKNDYLLKYSLSILLLILVVFTIYPDVVWDYYLVGLPIIFAVILSIILSLSLRLSNLKKSLQILIIALVAFNFRPEILPPYKIKWLGDGATYRNQKMAMDYIAAQKPTNYSFYAYSPAIFDYPFDYFIYWYAKRGVIEKPSGGQKTMYLLIRDDNGHTYLHRGWYGDKTKNKTTVLERKEFPGSLIVEKHLKND